MISLCVTPLRRLLGLPELIRFRRMLGLFAFFYGALHLITWLWLDKFFDLHDMWADVVKRRYITVGMLGFLLMVPLAVTSTAGWIRRLGGKRWQALHRAVYVSADRRRGALLVAGEVGHPQARDVRRAWWRCCCCGARWRGCASPRRRCGMRRR